MAPMGCPTYVKVNPPNYNTTPTTLHSPPLKSEILFQMIPRKKPEKKLNSVHQGLTAILVPFFFRYFCFCTELEYTKMHVKISKILGLTF